LCNFSAVSRICVVGELDAGQVADGDGLLPGELADDERGAAAGEEFSRLMVFAAGEEVPLVRGQHLEEWK
jgi:hypothetical protein